MTKTLVVVSVLLMTLTGLNAQSTFDLRINEVLVKNDSSYVDDFGAHVAWIEIFNGGYNNTNIGGCYLTNDLNNKTKYWIPKGDPRTIIANRYYAVFFADNKPTQGVFHLNFDLKDSKVLALYDSDGKTLIHKIDLPAHMEADVTYGFYEDGKGEMGILKKATPKANNNPDPKISSGDQFKQFDPYGIGLTVIAMIVVFSALITLYLIYKMIGNHFAAKGKAKVVAHTEKPTVKVKEEVLSAEVNAAIAMALYMYQNELHDEINPILTIDKVSRIYSPWSSKIYGLRQMPR